MSKSVKAVPDGSPANETPDGKIALAALQIGDSTLDGAAVTIHIYTEEVDAAFERAVGAGAKVQEEVQRRGAAAFVQMSAGANT